MTPNLRIHALALSAFVVVIAAASEQAPSQVKEQPARDLIRDVVYNELQDRAQFSLWQYHVEKRVGQTTRLEHQVETLDGPVHRVLANLNAPLTDVQRREERARLAELERDPALQQRIKQRHEEDEQKLESLMKLMPDAFLYDYDGNDQGLTRLKFHPDPAYNPPTYESRVFHGLAGTIWVDPRHKRLVRLSGAIVERIDFGYGLFGHIEKGGTFELARQQVSATHWKTSLVDVHMVGRMMLFKTVNRDQREVRSNFKPVPLNTTMHDGDKILSELAGPT